MFPFKSSATNISFLYRLPILLELRNVIPVGTTFRNQVIWDRWMLSCPTKIDQIIWMRRGDMLHLSLIYIIAAQPYTINLIVSAVKSWVNMIDFITKW